MEYLVNPNPPGISGYPGIGIWWGPIPPLGSPLYQAWLPVTPANKCADWRDQGQPRYTIYGQLAVVGAVPVPHHLLYLFQLHPILVQGMSSTAHVNSFNTTIRFSCPVLP